MLVDCLVEARCVGSGEHLGAAWSSAMRRIHATAKLKSLIRDWHSDQEQHTSLPLDDSRPLAALRSGEVATVRSLRGGGFRRRLAALGFTPGTEVKMLQNRGHGPVIVTIRDTRIALGRGEACKIRVGSD